MLKRNSEKDDAPQAAISRWPHRFALAMMLVTFPLIWAGGLVTSTDAGMAVHDWPTTFGYNMFLYPWQDWLFGPWDLFIEHGHRLLGTLAGLMAIGFLVAATWKDRRGWIKLAAVAALLLVILQGTLGGVRVLADDRFLAKVHGCVGPAFFAFTVMLVVFTSGFWRSAEGRLTETFTNRQVMLLRFMTASILIASFLQLVIGANLRHVPVSAGPRYFTTLTAMHIVFAVVVTVLILIVTTLFWFKKFRTVGVTRAASLLGLLVLVQVSLGCATWIVQYGWPGTMGDGIENGGYTILSKGFLQTNITTAHVAIGSLIIGISAWILAKTWRVTFFSHSSTVDRPHKVSFTKAVAV